MAALYSDEDVRQALVEELRLLGHDVLRAVDDGRANKKVPDREVLTRATQLGRAVLTLNRRHYHRLRRQNPNHAGIITATHDPDVAALAQRIHMALAAPNLTGALIRIVRPSSP